MASRNSEASARDDNTRVRIKVLAHYNEASVYDTVQWPSRGEPRAVSFERTLEG